MISINDIWTFLGDASLGGINYPTMDFSIEVEGRFYLALQRPVTTWKFILFRCDSGAISAAATVQSGNYATYYCDVACAQHSAGIKAYISVPQREPFTDGFLIRTTDGCATTQVCVGMSTYGTNFGAYCSVPYDSPGNTSDQWVYYGMNFNTQYKSVSGGGPGTYSAMAGIAPLGGIGHGNGMHNLLFIAGSGATPPYYSIDGGGTWTALPASNISVNWKGHFTTWDGETLETVLVAGGNDIRFWAAGDVAWTNKDGNIGDFAIGQITGIQRDSMGLA